MSSVERRFVGPSDRFKFNDAVSDTGVSFVLAEEGRVFIYLADNRVFAINYCYDGGDGEQIELGYYTGDPRIKEYHGTYAHVRYTLRNVAGHFTEMVIRNARPGPDEDFQSYVIKTWDTLEEARAEAKGVAHGLTGRFFFSEHGDRLLSWVMPITVEGVDNEFAWQVYKYDPRSRRPQLFYTSHSYWTAVSKAIKEAEKFNPNFKEV